MTISNYQPVEPTEVQKFAAGLAARADNVAADIVQRYRQNFEMLWYREGWDVSNVQAIADEMGAEFTKLMQLNGNLGQFIADNYPGQVPDSELSSPVSYTVAADGTLTFDPQGVYPGPQDS